MQGKKRLVILFDCCRLSYSGETASTVYRSLTNPKVRRIFILGPSHHFYLDGAALSLAENYSTPFGDIKVDQQLNKQLIEQNPEVFDTLSKEQDEEEHSLEMQLPFIYEMMSRNGIENEYKIVPILIGSISSKKEREFGQIFSKYLKAEENLFIISSDFCHWGKRFNFVKYNKEEGEIFESIERLDKRGMKLIHEKNFDEFKAYLKETKNTICGRHPIAVFLATIDATDEPEKYAIDWIKYAQSSKVKDMSDSSVSYASALCVRED